MFHAKLKICGFYVENKQKKKIKKLANNLTSRNFEVAELQATRSRKPFPLKEYNSKPGLNETPMKCKKVHKHVIRITTHNGELCLEIANREREIWRLCSY